MAAQVALVAVASEEALADSAVVADLVASEAEASVEALAVSEAADSVAAVASAVVADKRSQTINFQEDTGYAME